MSKAPGNCCHAHHVHSAPLSCASCALCPTVMLALWTMCAPAQQAYYERPLSGKLSMDDAALT